MDELYLDTPGAEDAEFVADMDFPQAISALVDGGGITRREWNDRRTRCVMHQGTLMIQLPDPAGLNGLMLHPWTITFGDMLATDWVRA